MAVGHAERRDASRILTGLETLRDAQGDHAHGFSGCGITGEGVDTGRVVRKSRHDPWLLSGQNADKRIGYRIEHRPSTSCTPAPMIP
jgi:hypothetical protein